MTELELEFVIYELSYSEIISTLFAIIVLFSGMGMDLRKKASGDKTIALQCDAEGKLRHDAIARIGHSKDKVGLNFLREINYRILSITNFYCLSYL